MIRHDITVWAKNGLHLRPAASIAEKANSFSSDLSIVANGKKADCRSVFEIIGLNVSCETSLSIIASGIDEIRAMEEIRMLFDCNFSEC